MEKIRNILGLEVHNGHIADKFTMIFIRILERLKNKLLNTAEGISVKEEIGPLESRSKILDDEEEKAYRKALLLLAELDPGYKKYLPKAKKDPGLISNLLKRKIRLALWVGTGNKIPFRELNAVLVKNLLREKGHSYRRKKGEMGWYRGGLFAGENLFEALEHLEKNEAIDRKLLTISF